MACAIFAHQDLPAGHYTFVLALDVCGHQCWRTRILAVKHLRLSIDLAQRTNARMTPAHASRAHTLATACLRTSLVPVENAGHAVVLMSLSMLTGLGQCCCAWPARKGSRHEKGGLLAALAQKRGLVLSEGLSRSASLTKLDLRGSSRGGGSGGGRG